jgi:uncharacterized protein (DUF58 family)
MIFLALIGVPLALAAAMIAPPLWLTGAGWVVFALGIFLLDATLAASPRRAAITLWTSPVIGVGRAEDVSVEAHFPSRAPSRVEFAIDTNERLRSEQRTQTCMVEAGVGRAHFTIAPVRRGEGAIEAVWARWRGPFGLCWRQLRLNQQRIIAVVPNIAEVKEQAVRLFQREAGQIGLRAQLRVGEGVEFNALKEFQSGMDRRMIDWKQTSRHGKLLAREFQAEENLHIMFAVDTGRLMCEPLAGLPRIDHAIQALLFLAFAALRLGDRVGVFAFDECPRACSGSVAGLNAFPVLQNVAAKLEYSTAETNFTFGLTQLSAKVTHRSIIVVFSDFSDTVGAELMVENLKLLLARHLVLFVVFRDEELEAMRRAQPKEPADVSRAVLADRMLRERETVVIQLRRLGVKVIEAPVEQIGMRLLETYLAVKRGAARV